MLARAARNRHLLPIFIVQISCHQWLQSKSHPPQPTHINAPLPESTIQLPPALCSHYGRCTIQRGRVGHSLGRCLRHHPGFHDVDRLSYHTRYHGRGYADTNIFHWRQCDDCFATIMLLFFVLQYPAPHQISRGKGGYHEWNVPRHCRFPSTVETQYSLCLPNFVHRLAEAAVHARDQPLFNHLLWNADQTAARRTARAGHQRTVPRTDHAEDAELERPREQREGASLGAPSQQRRGADVLQGPPVSRLGERAERVDGIEEGLGQGAGGPPGDDLVGPRWQRCRSAGARNQCRC
mmetsp:Transcript_8065/g.19843  ORF Transcript_8065/g.19843 Transcript_8065/m.19843 type:complete len:294 (+) Transcript_8065:1898-2779(+)